MTRHTPFDRASRAAVMAFVVVALVACAALALLLARNPKYQTTEFEATKVCLQVLGVVVIGGVVAIASFALQQQRLERSRVDAERREVERENHRRQSDRLVDDRHRVDERVRAMLEETLVAYHAVKRIRRLLYAETTADSGRRISIDVYAKYLPEVNDQQLAFESLKRRAPVIESPGLPGTSTAPEGVASDSLETLFRKVEQYLNDGLVDEYKTMRHHVKAHGELPLAELKALNSFVVDSDSFVAGASQHIDEIVSRLERALLAPTYLPDV